MHGGTTWEKGRELGIDKRFLFAGLAARNADHRVWESRRGTGCMVEQREEDPSHRFKLRAVEMIPTPLLPPTNSSTEGFDQKMEFGVGYTSCSLDVVLVRSLGHPATPVTFPPSLLPRHRRLGEEILCDRIQKVDRANGPFVYPFRVDVISAGSLIRCVPPKVSELLARTDSPGIFTWRASRRPFKS